MNSYFATIGKKLQNKFSDKPPSWIGPDSIYDFSFVGIEADFVYKLLLNLSTKSNIDVLDFDCKLLRISGPII